MFATYRSA